MKNQIIFMVIIIIMALIMNAAWAHEETDEEENFIFGNHIDTHQATIFDDNELEGIFKITFTGEISQTGAPVAKHCDVDTPPEKCVTGWKLKGAAGEATFVYHNNDHPVWVVEGRRGIPQPGSFSHFHWITANSNDSREITDVRCNVSMAGMLQRGTHCPGYFLQLKAVRTFAFKHGNEMILINKGIDLASHINIVTSLDPTGASVD